QGKRGRKCGIPGIDDMFPCPSVVNLTQFGKLIFQRVPIGISDPLHRVNSIPFPGCRTKTWVPSSANTITLHNSLTHPLFKVRRGNQGEPLICRIDGATVETWKERIGRMMFEPGRDHPMREMIMQQLLKRLFLLLPLLFAISVYLKA